MKLQTPVDIGTSDIRITFQDKILMAGSCFTDNIGKRMAIAGFDVCVNPFGTLYNPISVCNSLNRLLYAAPFTEDECIQMGSGSPLICSFSHHTSFARETAGEFLENANARLSEASAFYRECNTVIITLGTSWCYLHTDSGNIVSNCLKRNANEFTRKFISAGETAALLSRFISRPENQNKRFIITVSPIRHLKDGAHGNQISKASLLIAAETLCSTFPDRCCYFPSYEIMMDELRDYRFYAEDMVHPSDQAVGYIWERFCDFAISDSDRRRISENEKAYRQSQHIQGYRQASSTVLR